MSQDLGTFDFIVVGAGSAGCVLARRLSDTAGTTVLLLEAGGSGRNPLYSMPMLAGRLNRLKMNNWSYYTEPQKHLGGRSVFLPRGRMVGGSFMFNGAVYVRGNPYDYDSWRQMGNTGWSYADVLPYFKRSETYDDGANEFHGGDGPLPVSHSGAINPLAEAFIRAGVEAGFPVNHDFNGASQDGFGRHDHNIFRGRRRTTAAAFLTERASRTNLRVVSDAHVGRIVIRDGRATGLELTRGGEACIATARREIVIASGAVNTPQLLMLSGIGPADHLTEHGILPVHHLPGVGANLQDHLVVTVGHECRQPVSLVDTLRIEKFFVQAARCYLLGKGPVAMSPIHAGGFIRTDPSLPAPDLQIAFYPILGSSPSAGTPRLLWPWQPKPHSYAGVIWRNRPVSRGTVRLRSADFRDPLRIDPNYLDDESDLMVSKRAVWELRRVFAQKAFDPYRGTELLPGTGVQTDAETEAFVRSTGLSGYHLAGTAKMGHDGAAVVDDQLRVHGIAGLRVADASIIPLIITGNTNAATIMIAEKASDLMLGQSLPRLEPSVQRAA